MRVTVEVTENKLAREGCAGTLKDAKHAGGALRFSGESVEACWEESARASGVSIEAWLETIAGQQAANSAHSATSTPIWDVIAGRVQAMDRPGQPLPDDAASQHDHYLYGSAKKPL